MVGYDRVEGTCICCIILTKATARYTSSRRRISTKRLSLLCRAKKSDCGTLRSGLILLKMIRGMLREFCHVPHERASRRSHIGGAALTKLDRALTALGSGAKMVS